jgi:beta-glucanase (GH16 family)
MSQPKKRTTKFLLALIIICLLPLALIGCSIVTTPTPTATMTVPTPTATITLVPTPTITPQPTPTPVDTADEDHDEHYILDDFETESLFSGEDPYGIGLGFVTWGDPAASMMMAGIREIPADDPRALPLQSGDNRVLVVSGVIPEWGGVTHNFEGPDGDVWASMDWSTWLGVTFWVYGSDTGSELLFEIQENRNPGSMVNDVEVWSYSLRDNFSGWKQYYVPWNKFHRKEIENGAPRDGRTLTEVHGWAFGVVNPSPDSVTYYLDDVALYGEIAGLDRVDVTFDTGVILAVEGDRVGVNVRLTNECDEPVTVNYAAQQSDAVEGKDYEPLVGSLTFDAHQTVQMIDLTLIDDAKPEGTEGLFLFITGAENATLGELTSVYIYIEDNDLADPAMLMDIEEDTSFDIRGADSTAIKDFASDDELALPEQTGVEGVLEIAAEMGEATLTRRYGEAQDWSAAEAFSFWYYGAGTGETVTVELRNNPGYQTQDLTPNNWTKVWEDAFEGEAGAAPDFGRWEPRIGDGLNQGMEGWGNNELEYYTAEPENLALDGEGHLVITAHELDADTDLVCWYGPCAYTSARLTTKDRLEFTYGRVEASMKLPEGTGLWPAFWMMGNNSDTAVWPASGELDIMEFIGSEPGVVYGTAHGPGYVGAEGLGGNVDLGVDLSAGFHEYAVEWEPDEINWFVDDRLFATVHREDVPGEWVFDHPFYLLLNLAVGGNWPGSPDEATVFPQSLVVDTIRIYGAGETYERFVAGFADDFTGWRQVTLPFAEFVRSSHQPWGAPDDGMDLSQIYGYSVTLPARPESYYLDQFRLRD